MSIFLQANSWFPRPSAAEIAAGTSTETRAWAPVDIVSAINTWAPSAPGVMANPMTTIGDMIYASASGTPATPARLAAGPEGAEVRINASGVPVWIPAGETALSIAGGLSTIDMAAGRTFTGTLTGAVTFSVSNTWGHRSFALILTNSGVVAEPTWPTGSLLWGEGTWDTANGAKNVVVFTWRAAGSLGYSIGQQA